MFENINIYNREKEYVPYEKTVTATITEKRAPTDESVKLLNEFQEKAKENIIKSIVIDSNIAKCVCIYYQDVLFDNKILFHIRFVLNGKEHIVSDSIDYFEIQGMKINAKNDLPHNIHEHVFKFFHRKFAEWIAAELMMQEQEFLKKISEF